MHTLTSLPAAPRPLRTLLATAALLVALGALLASSASPASAATQIAQSANFICGNGRIAVSPPRVWANYGRTEQVVWIIAIERWNGARWYRYSTSSYIASFNHFGSSPTSWSMFNTRNGGRYINSRMQVPISHRGSYRVGSAVAAPGRTSAVYVGGPSNYCTFR
jgi:hypothetical protein